MFGIIIRNDKEKEFFNKLDNSVPDEKFWDDCRNIRENITEEAVCELNKLMDGD